MKRLFGLLLLVVLFFIHSTLCFAEEPVIDPDRVLYDMGAYELAEKIPDNAKHAFDEIRFSQMELSEIAALSPQQFVQVLKVSAAAEIKAPLEVFALIMGIVLLSAIFKGISDSFPDSSINNVFAVVAVLCALGFITEPVISCIYDAAQVLKECAAFILAFIPFFAGAVAAGGHPVTAVSYHFFLVAACQGVAQAAARILLPLMSIYFAVTLAAAVVPGLKLKGITQAVKSVVCWSLGLMTTLFVGLFSVQTMVNTGSDALSIKASKFMLGSFVPIIGGALSDAFSAAHGCLLLVKSTLGAFGIVVAALTFIPLVIKVALWCITTMITAQIALMVESEELAEVLEAAGTVLSVLLALLMCFALLIIVCTTVVMVLGFGG
ncbi:MAG: hypothetical protein IKV41_07385 [Oscillospiraceae bacterium]|nr:hypothetical protein [Oscillospiraceae bacterium]